MFSTNKWYSVGNVTIINGSTTVSGQNTAWLEADIKQGDIFVINNKMYEISRVVSSTELILTKAFSDASVENVSYAIIQRAKQVLAVNIAYKLEKMVENWEKFVTDYNTQFIELRAIAKIIKKAGLCIDEDGDLAQDDEHGGEDFSPDSTQIATQGEVNEMLDDVWS